MENGPQTATIAKRRPKEYANRAEHRARHLQVTRARRKHLWREAMNGSPSTNERPAWTSSATRRREEGPKPFLLHDWTGHNGLVRIQHLPFHLPA